MKYRVFGDRWTSDVEVKDNALHLAKWKAIEERADRLELGPNQVVKMFSKTFFIVDRSLFR